MNPRDAAELDKNQEQTKLTVQLYSGDHSEFYTLGVPFQGCVTALKHLRVPLWFCGCCYKNKRHSVFRIQKPATLFVCACVNTGMPIINVNVYFEKNTFLK